ncbi:MAG: InlB B-repeat-containing protein [Paludibacteraceae bacterium]|nr:InlB B-repeat-containing protein [Paludibacteraceae bacterium]
MKKIYSLLLLAGLCLFGVQNAKAASETFPKTSTMYVDITGSSATGNIYMKSAYNNNDNDINNYAIETVQMVNVKGNIYSAAIADNDYVRCIVVYYGGESTSSPGSELFRVSASTRTSDSNNLATYLNATSVTWGHYSPLDYDILKEDGIGVSLDVADGANEGDAVLVTPSLKNSFSLASLSVVDATSNPVYVTNNGDGTYSFVMPASDVTVSATAQMTAAYIAGIGNDWNHAVMNKSQTDDNVFFKTFSNLAATGENYQAFKITNGEWVVYWGEETANIVVEGTYVTHASTDNDKNICFQLSHQDDITITFTFNATGTPTIKIAGTIVKYHVTYNGGEGATGEAPADATAYDVNGEVTVLGQGTLAKDGYVFKGWDTDESADEVVYVENNTFNINAETTLYAVWAPVYTVTYNANGAEGDVPADANKYENGAEVTVLGQGALVKEGYAFAGWNTQADGMGTAYAAAATFAMGSANVVLYAQWNRIVTIHFAYTGTSSWTTRAYVWKEGETTPSWPGSTEGFTASGHDGWVNYEVIYPINNRVIFNDGNQTGGDGHQTADIVIDGSVGELFVASNGYATASAITVTTNPDGYASFYGDVRAAVPAGIEKVYSAEYISGETITLREEADYLANGIPAHTGVILKGAASTAYTLAYDWSAPGTSTNNNSLAGVVNNYDFGMDGKYRYVLSYQNEQTAFFKYGGAYMPANKAYLQLDAEASAPALRIVEGENNTTDINAIEASEKAQKFFENGQLFILRDGVVYDATGRAVR